VKRLILRSAAAHASESADTLRCALGCLDIELDGQGLVKRHRPWYQGGRFFCYGSGEPPKGGAS
jgi:hypothetical protein